MFLEPESSNTDSGGAPRKPTPEELRQRHIRKRRLVRTGQVVMLIGAVVGVIHWLTHIGVFGSQQPPLWLDMVAGYPMAAILLITGATVASKK